MNNSIQKHFKNLGLSEGCSKEDIKKAYRKLAHKYHPDKHSNSSSSDLADAEEKFKQIKESYDFLMNYKPRSYNTQDSYNGYNSHSYNYNSSYNNNYYNHNYNYNSHRYKPYFNRKYYYINNLKNRLVSLVSIFFIVLIVIISLPILISIITSIFELDLSLSNILGNLKDVIEITCEGFMFLLSDISNYLKDVIEITCDGFMFLWSDISNYLKDVIEIIRDGFI